MAAVLKKPHEATFNLFYTLIMDAKKQRKNGNSETIFNIQ